MKNLSPKKKEKQYRRKKLGTWYQVGRIIVLIGAILGIVIAILSLIPSQSGNVVWNSYTFGLIDIPYLAPILSILFSVLIVWMAIDNRFAYRMHLVLLAIILIVLAILVGNIGGLIVIVGAILYIFEQLSKQ